MEGNEILAVISIVIMLIGVYLNYNISEIKSH
jgi:hypothetical protein